MNAHIDVNPDSGRTYTLVATAANMSEITQAHAMLHGDETTAFGDASYQGVEKRQENENSAVAWHVAMHPGKRCEVPDTKTERLHEPLEKLKPGVRAKVEHPFHVLKNVSGHNKARYRGLAKSTAQLHTLFGVANLMIEKRRLFELHAQGAPEMAEISKTTHPEAIHTLNWIWAESREVDFVFAPSRSGLNMSGFNQLLNCSARPWKLKVFFLWSKMVLLKFDIRNHLLN